MVTVRLAASAVLSCFLFLFLLTLIPDLEFETAYGENLLTAAAAMFVVSVLIAAVIRFEYLAYLLLIFAFTMPLSRLTDGGAYNIVTTGLLFGAMFRLRPKEIHLNQTQIKLFAALLLLGLYLNAVPLIFNDGSGFHPKLWLYNFSIVLKYIFIGLIAIQARIAISKLFTRISWFALIYASFVIVEAFHIHAINILMKSFSLLWQRPDQYIRRTADHYYRSSGLAYDPNDAAIRLSLLLVIALFQFRTSKINAVVVPMIFAAILLTGSRIGLVVSATAIFTWIVYFRTWSIQWRVLVKWCLVAIVILAIGSSNHSFWRVTNLGILRSQALITLGRFSSDQSFDYRKTELLEIENTAFGDRSDNLNRVHGGLARTMRFYGLFGVLAVIAFWAYWAKLARSTYIGFALVVVLAMTAFTKWTFQIEGTFIPVVFISTLLMRSKNDGIEESRKHSTSMICGWWRRCNSCSSVKCDCECHVTESDRKVTAWNS